VIARGRDDAIALGLAGFAVLLLSTISTRQSKPSKRHWR
jgi:hypothetical protein